MSVVCPFCHTDGWMMMKDIDDDLWLIICEDCEKKGDNK